MRQRQSVHQGHRDCPQVCVHQEMLLTTRPLLLSPSRCVTPRLLTSRRNLPRWINPRRSPDDYLKVPTVADLPDHLPSLLCTYLRPESTPLGRGLVPVCLCVYSSSLTIIQRLSGSNPCSVKLQKVQIPHLRASVFTSTKSI